MPNDYDHNLQVTLKGIIAVNLYIVKTLGEINYRICPQYNVSESVTKKLLKF